MGTVNAEDIGAGRASLSPPSATELQLSVVRATLPKNSKSPAFAGFLLFFGDDYSVHQNGIVYPGILLIHHFQKGLHSGFDLFDIAL